MESILKYNLKNMVDCEYDLRIEYKRQFFKK